MLWPVREWLGALWSFCRLGRPVFLLGGFVLYAVGAAWARHWRGALDGGTYLWGQATITAAQLMTHYANDYFDLEADRANVTPTRWSGGSRVLVQSALPPRVALGAALVLGLLALALGLVTAARAPEPALSIAELLAIVGLAWAYSAPPARLVGRGAGELATALVVTVLTPLWAFHLQRSHADGAFLLTLLVLALLQITMLFAINFPDAAGDRSSGKRTLVVLLGTARAVAACRLLLLVWGLTLPVLGVTLQRLGLPWWIALGPGICAPVAVWQAFSLGALAHPAPATSVRSAYAGIAFRGVAMLFVASAATLGAIVAADWVAGGARSAGRDSQQDMEQARRLLHERQRSAREQAAAHEGHQDLRQVDPRARLAPAASIEGAERAIGDAGVARQQLRPSVGQHLGRHEGLADPVGGQRIQRERGVAQQHGTGEPS